MTQMMKKCALLLALIYGTMGSVQVRGRRGTLLERNLSCRLCRCLGPRTHWVLPRPPPPCGCVVPTPTNAGVLLHWNWRRYDENAGVDHNAVEGRVWRRGPAAVAHPWLHYRADVSTSLEGPGSVYGCRGLQHFRLPL